MSLFQLYVDDLSMAYTVEPRPTGSLFVPAKDWPVLDKSSNQYVCLPASVNLEDKDTLRIKVPDSVNKVYVCFCWSSEYLFQDGEKKQTPYEGKADRIQVMLWSKKCVQWGLSWDQSWSPQRYPNPEYIRIDPPEGRDFSAESTMAFDSKSGKVEDGDLFICISSGHPVAVLIQNCRDLY